MRILDVLQDSSFLLDISLQGIESKKETLWLYFQFQEMNLYRFFFLIGMAKKSSTPLTTLRGFWLCSRCRIIIHSLSFNYNYCKNQLYIIFYGKMKIRYTSSTGRKSIQENYAYLPTTISDVDEHGNIVYAQWNYQILCHPLKRHVPLSRWSILNQFISDYISKERRHSQLSQFVFANRHKALLLQLLSSQITLNMFVGVVALC